MSELPGYIKVRKYDIGWTEPWVLFEWCCDCGEYDGRFLSATTATKAALDHAAICQAEDR